LSIIIDYRLLIMYNVMYDDVGFGFGLGLTLTLIQGVANLGSGESWEWRPGILLRLSGHSD